MPSSATSHPNLRSARIVDGRSWIVDVREASAFSSNPQSPITDPSSPGGAPSPMAHADGTSMIGPWIEDRGSRMSGSRFLSLPIQNVNSRGLPPFIKIQGQASSNGWRETQRPVFHSARTALLLFFLAYLILQVKAGQFGVFTYEDSGSTITITRVEITATGPVSIPPQIDGKPVTTIGEGAFDYCESITAVSIPASATNINWISFRKCTSLAEFEVDGANPSFLAVDGVVFDPTLTVLIAFPSGRAGAYTVPTGTLEIGPHAFQDNHVLTSVEMSDGLVSIGDWAFESCFALETVICPQTLQTIGLRAFSECHSLLEFTLPSALVNVGDYAFSACRSLQSVTVPPNFASFSANMFMGCSALETIDLPDFITVIPDAAFYDCTALGNVVLPASLTHIGAEAFGLCDGMTEVVLPEGLLEIGNRAFTNCGGLESVNFPDGLIQIGEEAFRYCHLLESAVLPDSLETLGKGAFAQCSSLTTAVLPPNLTEISDDLFSYCIKVTAITLPPGITSIGSDAFSGTALTTILIPAGVSFIGESAFHDCAALQQVYIPATVTQIAPAAFRFCTSLTTIEIPASVESLGELAFYGCSSLTSIHVDDASLHYSDEDGVLFDYLKTTLIQYPPGRGAPTIAQAGRPLRVPKSPNAGEFYAIPTSVVLIGDSAFAGALFLDGVTIPNGLLTIGANAFEACPSLESIVVADENPAFIKQEGLLLSADGSELIRSESNKTGVFVIPNGVTSIRATAFSACGALEGITIPAMIAQIGDRAFESCANLSHAWFLGNSPTMGEYIFRDTASDFQIHYFTGKPSFTSPMWLGYPSAAMGGETGFAIWLLNHGLSHDADSFDDGDCDGIVLLLEYAFNLDPRHAQFGAMTQTTLSGNKIICRFYAGSQGIAYHVETSTDLKNWSVNGVTLSEPDEDLYRTATVAFTSGSRFIRVVASKTP